MVKIYNFTKYRFLFLALSILLIVGFWAGTYFQNWFNMGIDFKAGLNLQVQIDNSDANQASVSEAVTGFSNTPQIQQVGSEEELRFSIRVGEEDGMDNFNRVAEEMIIDSLESVFGSSSVTVESSQFVGARYAGSLASSTLWLTIAALVLILLYIWIRFKLNYAVSAIAAVIHDVLFLVGVIGLFQLEVSLGTVAAVLTIIGYSLNDTIVIFDRIRENAVVLKDKSFSDIVDISVSQSLSRTLITSITTLIAVVSIYIFSTGAIQTFALNLIIGVIVGTYSSIFIASTILIGWHDKVVQKKARIASAAKSSSGRVVSINQPKKEAPEAVKQSAEEIAAATEKKKKAKQKKKKKK